MNIDADGDTPCEFCHKLILRKETIEFRNTCYFHLRCWEEVYKKWKQKLHLTGHNMKIKLEHLQAITITQMLVKLNLIRITCNI